MMYILQDDSKFLYITKNKCCKWEMIQKCVHVSHNLRVPSRERVCTETFKSLPTSSTCSYRLTGRFESSCITVPYCIQPPQRQFVPLPGSNDSIQQPLRITTEFFFAVPLQITTIVANKIRNFFFCGNSVLIAQHLLCVCVCVFYSVFNFTVDP